MTMLFVWYGEGSTEAEKLIWKRFCASDAMREAVLLEVEDRERAEAEHERLTKEGWMLQGVGSGSFARLSSYTKPNV